MPQFDSTGLGGIPRLITNSDTVGIGDIAELVANLVNQNYKTFAPLQGFAGDTLKGIASGDDSMLQRQAAPAISGIKSQLPQVQRQLSDKIGSGGALAEAQGNAIQGQQGDISKLLAGMQTNLTNTALNTGMNVTPQAISPLLAVGGLRNQAKAASEGGGKK